MRHVSQHDDEITSNALEVGEEGGGWVGTQVQVTCYKCERSPSLTVPAMRCTLAFQYRPNCRT